MPFGIGTGVFAMMIDRKTAHAPKSASLVTKVAGLQGPCVGCKDCTGLCPALIEALVLPDIILRKPT